MARPAAKEGVRVCIVEVYKDGEVDTALDDTDGALGEETGAILSTEGQVTGVKCLFESIMKVLLLRLFDPNWLPLGRSSKWQALTAVL